MVMPLQGWLRDPTRTLTVLVTVLLIVLVSVPLPGQAEPLSLAPAGDEVPPAEAWLEAALTGKSLPVLLDGEERSLQLDPNDDILRGSLSFQGPNPVHPLEGQIEGSPDSHLRATVFGEKLLGYIEDPQLGRFVLAPDSEGGLRALRPPPAPAQAPTVPPHDLVIPADDFGCLHPMPAPLGNPIGLLEGWQERWFDLAVAVDQEFVDRHGDDWEAVATALVNNADGFYFTQVDLHVGIVDLRVNDDLTGSTAWELLVALRSHYRTHHSELERDNVHLMTGKNLDVLGESLCIGGAGDNDLAYTVGMTAHHDTFTFLGLTLWGDIYTKILIHELGHILSAHHHYANCAETVPFYDTSRPIDTCTLMTNSADVLMLKFSMMSKLATRGWADSREL